MVFHVTVDSDHSYTSTLTRSFYLMLNEFYKNLRSIGASTVSGAEMEEFFKVTELRSLIQKLCLVPLLVTQYACPWSRFSRF